MSSYRVDNYFSFTEDPWTLRGLRKVSSVRKTDYFLANSTWTLHFSQFVSAHTCNLITSLRDSANHILAQSLWSKVSILPQNVCCVILMLDCFNPLWQDSLLILITVLAVSLSEVLLCVWSSYIFNIVHQQHPQCHDILQDYITFSTPWLCSLIR